MEGSASSCCGVEPSACRRAAKASLVGAKKVAVTYGEFTSSAPATCKIKNGHGPLILKDCQMVAYTTS